MPAPTPSWQTVRIHGTWVNQDGSMKAGTYKVSMPVRVTNATDDVIIPKGVFAAGSLNTTPGLPSLDVQVPAGDDPDNSPNGFQPVLEVTFLDAPGELYALDVPVALAGDADGIDLADVVLSESLPIPANVLIRGVPGGLAELDAEGDVIDAEGNKILAGGGGGGGTGGGLGAANNLSDVPDKPAARTNLGLGTAATRGVGTSSGTVAAGDDARLSDARTPTAHKTTHAVGGSDPLTAADIGAVPADEAVELPLAL